jgi:hypothetical protein
MSYPWKRDPTQLPDNRIQAEMKLYTLEKQLRKNQQKATLYDEQIKKMVKLDES